MAKMVNPRFKKPPPRYYFREWRKHRQLTLVQVSEETGQSVSSLSQLETGKQGFSDTTLNQLADVYGCSPGELLMRNPLADDPNWTIWDNLKKASPEKRKEISAVVDTMLKAAS